MKIRPLLIALALLTPVPATADIYRVEHADGSVSFTDRPPRAEAQAMDLPALNTVAPREMKPLAPLQRSKPKTQAQPSDKRERYAENCHRIKQRLTAIDKERRTGYTVGRGEKLKHQRSQLQQDRRFYCR